VDQWQRFVSILRIVDWAGGTVHGRKKLQKTVYLLQTLGAPIDERFGFHFYGPYSEELAEEVDLVRHAGWLNESKSVIPNGYASTFELTEEGRLVLADASESLDASLAPVVQRICQESARFLELVATVEFLRRTGLSMEETRARIPQLKPEQSYTSEEIERALGFVPDLREGASSGACSS
jgi:uncharacterized protein YwgA